MYVLHNYTHTLSEKKKCSHNFTRGKHKRETERERVVSAKSRPYARATLRWLPTSLLCLCLQLLVSGPIHSPCCFAREPSEPFLSQCRVFAIAKACQSTINLPRRPDPVPVLLLFPHVRRQPLPETTLPVPTPCCYPVLYRSSPLCPCVAEFLTEVVLTRNDPAPPYCPWLPLLLPDPQPNPHRAPFEPRRTRALWPCQVSSRDTAVPTSLRVPVLTPSQTRTRALHRRCLL